MGGICETDGFTYGSELPSNHHLGYSITGKTNVMVRCVLSTEHLDGKFCFQNECVYVCVCVCVCVRMCVCVRA